MTFKDLKTNYPVYLFDKNAVKLYEGKVTNINAPHIDIKSAGAGGGMVVDVTLQYNTENNGSQTCTYTFKDSTEIGYINNIVISTNKDLILKEVEALCNQSKQILQSVETNKNIVNRCQDILSEYNPAIKEKKEYDERFSSLENQVKDMKSMIETLVNKLNNTSENEQRTEK